MESGGPSSTNHEPSHQVSLDIKKLAKSVKKELQISNPFSDTCCIYKVPERLREVNEKAYTPRVVSIGPIHHGNEKLKAMEDQKRMYLQEFIAQSEVSVEGFIELIKEKETRLRHCYAETNGFSSEYFIKMILMDAAFVIMCLLKWTYTDFRESRDSIFYPPYRRYDVKADICLLENQLPFFILQDLFAITQETIITKRNQQIANELHRRKLPAMQANTLLAHDRGQMHTVYKVLRNSGSDEDQHNKHRTSATITLNTRYHHNIVQNTLKETMSIWVRTDTPRIQDGFMYCDKASPAVLEGLTILSFCRTTCIPGPSSLLLQQGRRNDTRRDLQL